MTKNVMRFLARGFPLLGHVIGRTCKRGRKFVFTFFVVWWPHCSPRTYLLVYYCTRYDVAETRHIREWEKTEEEIGWEGRDKPYLYVLSMIRLTTAV